MKNKKFDEDNYELMKELFGIAFGSTLGALILGYLLNIVLFYNIFPWIPKLSDFLMTLSRESLDLFYAVTFEACLFAGFVCSMFIFASYPTNRGDAFTKYTEGRMTTYKDGIIHHLKTHWPMELLINFEITLIALVLETSFLESSPYSLLYRYLGLPIGIVASVFITAILQLLVIRPAQKRWMIQYYFDE